MHNYLNNRFAIYLKFFLIKDFCKKIVVGSLTKWESYLYKMNITNSFFYISGYGQRDSRFKTTEQIIKLDYESWVYPLDKLGHMLPLDVKNIVSPDLSEDLTGKTLFYVYKIKLFIISFI